VYCLFRDSVTDDPSHVTQERVYVSSFFLAKNTSSLRAFEFTMSVDSYDIAEEIRDALPGTEEIIVQYLSGYLVDDAGEDEDTLQVTRDILESAVAEGREDALEKLLARLSDMLEEQIKARTQSRRPTLRKLGNVMDMSKAGSMSNTIAFSEGVDLESVNKAKCARLVNLEFLFLINPRNGLQSITGGCQEA
jgi:hypothetical protein